MIKHILSGIKAYFGSFKLISQLGLWKYFWVPILLSILIAALIFSVAYSLSDNIGSMLSQWWTWDWGQQTVYLISEVFGGILILILGFILYKHMVMAFSAPFMGPVSEKIEAHLSGRNPQNLKHTSFAAQLWRGVRINLRNLTMEILLTIPIILIGLIPIVGLFSAFLLFMVQGYYAGFGNMDYTLERHYSYKESIRFVKNNKGIAIGNGIVFMLFLFIPVVGVILILPLSVTAATVQTVELLKLEKEID